MPTPSAYRCRCRCRWWLEPLAERHAERLALRVRAERFRVERVVLGLSDRGRPQRRAHVVVALGDAVDLARAGLALDVDVLLGQVHVEVRHERDLERDLAARGRDGGRRGRAASSHPGRTRRTDARASAGRAGRVRRGAWEGLLTKVASGFRRVMRGELRRPGTDDSLAPAHPRRVGSGASRGDADAPPPDRVRRGPRGRVRPARSRSRAGDRRPGRRRAADRDAAAPAADRVGAPSSSSTRRTSGSWTAPAATRGASRATPAASPRRDSARTVASSRSRASTRATPTST